MRILFVSAECAPFSKTGGLGDVSAALPRALANAGHDVLLVTPLYASVVQRRDPFEPLEGVGQIGVKLGRHDISFSVVRTPLPASDVNVHLIHCPALYDRPGIYTHDGDEHLRFLLLNHAALALCQRLKWAPDIVHVNDWHTAMVPLTLKVRYSWDRLFAGTRSVLTIHNLAHQGGFGAEILQDTGLADAAHLFHQDELREGRISFLHTGILYADALTTVSPTYARQIQQPANGMGLHDSLRARADHLFGILNGVDDTWNPAHDKLIPFQYSAKEIERKEANKRALHEGLGLAYDPTVPCVGIVSRLAWQKGLDLALEVLPDLIRRRNIRVAILGNGERNLEDGFSWLQHAFPRRVCFYSGYNERLAHLVEAGSDIFLMPSRFEPCGLNQMYSLRYGTVPVVHRTGGLADTVQQWEPITGEGTGFLFDHHDRVGLHWALDSAIRTFPDRQAWRKLQRNGMAQDFSWTRQAGLYTRLYSSLTGRS